MTAIPPGLCWHGKRGAAPAVPCACERFQTRGRSCDDRPMGHRDDHEAMLRHYDEQDEGARLLRSGHGRLELLRTRELLERFLPSPPCRVLDVGGGTGVHASWLAGRGYDVHLLDPVPRHVEEAGRHGAFTATLGDARSLPEPAGSVGGVLLLGPLYHLVSAADRLTALREARRVLERDGVLLAAAISRYMALLDWAASGELTAEVAARLSAVIATGRHDPSLGFTTAFFHTPAELAAELAAAGFQEVRVLGIEGPAWAAVDAAGPERWESYLPSALLAARLTEGDPALLPSSAHLLAVGRCG